LDWTYFLAIAKVAAGDPAIDWTPVLVAGIPAAFVFAGTVIVHQSKKVEQAAQQQLRLEEKVDRQAERIDGLEKRLNDETRQRRIEQRFNHLLVMDVDVAIRFLEFLQEYLIEYADILPGEDSPTTEQVQAVLNRLQAAIARSHDYDDDSGHVI